MHLLSLYISLHGLKGLEFMQTSGDMQGCVPFSVREGIVGNTQ